MIGVEFLCADGSLICTNGVFTTLLSLITDRTQRDVDRVEELAEKGWDAMTEQERAEWLGELKGAYNDSDLNRVGQAISYIADLLTGYGYSVQVSPKTDWTMSDIPTREQLEQYLANVAALRQALPVLPTTPEPPPDMDGLTWAEANDIEKILVDINHLITNMTAAWFYSGDLYAEV